MVVPGNLRKTTLKDRKRMRQRIEHDADRQRRAISNIEIRGGRNPPVMILMMLVLVILGGLVIGRANMSTRVSNLPTREMRAEKELHALRIALERFRIDCQRYPLASEGLRALVVNPGETNWGGHYVNIIKPDPWRTPYYYTLTNDTIRLLSHGPDKRINTADDLVATPPDPDEIQWKLTDSSQPRLDIRREVP
jgi:type II secretion system protein G